MEKVLNKFIERIKSSYPEDDKLMIDLQDFYKETQALQLLQPEVIKSLPIDFVKWYSGMEESKILNALERWKNENSNVL